MNPILGTLESMRLAPDIVEQFVMEIPADRLDVERRPGFWTIRDHITHLAEVQPMLHERLRRFRDEQSPDFTPFVPGTPDNQESSTAAVPAVPIPDSLAVFRSWRLKQIEVIAGFSESVWPRGGHHPGYSHYTPGILIRHSLMHDYWHMYRVEELWLAADEYLTELH